MVQRVKRVGVFQYAKMTAVLCFVLSIIGLLLAWGFSSIFAGMGMGRGAYGMGMGAAFLVFAPVIYAIFGFIFGALGAWLYNVTASIVGGIEIELE